jgi:DNA repair protein RecN (Recombination protein N)
MIQLLHIENIAVIEKADITFGRGLNVLTGETGAGKSIVIDALSAVIGGRASRELVRTDAAGATVTAVFSDAGVSDWCEENGIEPDEDGKLFLMRKITPDGKNTCKVNGSPISVAQLRELGGMLIDIHGQNDGRKLLDEGSHRKYLDSFGGLSDVFETYAKAYKAFKEKAAEIEALSMDESEKERRIDSLKFQLNELDRADIKPGETAEKTARRDLLKNASKLTEAVDGAFYTMYGGDITDGVVALIGEAEAQTSSAARYSDDLRSIADKLRELLLNAQDVTEELRDFRSSLDFSPEELDGLEARLDLLRRLGRKYGGSEEEILAYRDKCRAELDEIEFSADKLVKLEKELDSLKKTAVKAAEQLSAKRKAAAQKLEERIKEELSGLNMAGVRFKVEFEEVPGEYGLNSAGKDEIRFLMSANAGETPGRISHIASGGELSRIMLAMKNVLTENDDISTMVFDEVDTGVSGIAAQRVGEKLSDLARHRQVLCVTHLPQIAAMADAHFEIEKKTQNGRTFTYVNQLDTEGSTHELARLIGGENITVTTMASAAELKAAAQEYKKKK